VPTVPLTFAVTYKHSGNVKLTGDAHFTAVPPSFQPMIHDQAVSEDMTIPNELYIGAAYEVIPNLKVMASYNFEHWSTYKSDTFVGADGFTVTVPRNYENAHVIRAAGEWVQPEFLPAQVARGGPCGASRPALRHGLAVAH
jgi:long-subunit fatty acid transport protein